MMIPQLKQIYDLRSSHLLEHPIWVSVYSLDRDQPWYRNADIDEATFRPWDFPRPIDCKDPGGRRFIMAINFAFADDTNVSGFGYAPEPWLGEKGSAVDTIQPRILFQNDR